MITALHAHTAYMQCGRADSTTSGGLIPKQTLRIIGQAALAHTWRFEESSNEIFATASEWKLVDPFLESTDAPRSILSQPQILSPARERQLEPCDAVLVMACTSKRRSGQTAVSSFRRIGSQAVRSLVFHASATGVDV